MVGVKGDMVCVHVGKASHFPHQTTAILNICNALVISIQPLMPAGKVECTHATFPQKKKSTHSVVWTPFSVCGP